MSISGTAPNSPTRTGANGRMRGYTDELDWVERTISGLLQGKSATFEVTDRKVIGTRGFFVRRNVSKYEYVITAETRREVEIVVDLIRRCIERIS